MIKQTIGLIRKLILSTGFALLAIASVQAQTPEVSVSFTMGWFGTVGNNTNTNENVKSFTTLNIARVSFVQPDGDGDGLFSRNCGSQGNDVCGTIRIYQSTGVVTSLSGFLNWRTTETGKVKLLGFVFADGQTATLNYGAGQTLNLVGGINTGNTNMSLRRYGVTNTYAEGSVITGNAATTGLLEALNEELLNSPQPSTITLASASVIEGQSLVYTCTLNMATTDPQVFTFSTEGTATSGSDYNATYTFSNGVVNNGDGTITVPPGVTSFTVTVNTIDDVVAESSETVIIKIGSKSATGSILDNEGPGVSLTGPLTAFSACIGQPSAAKTVTVSGALLTADITVTAPTGYEVSLSASSGYGNSVTVARSGSSVSPTTVYVRLKANASSGASGNITATSTGAATQSLATGSATVNALPTLSFSPTSPSMTPGGSVTITASGASTYAWSPSSGLSSTTAATVTANPSATTSYTVTGTDANGCQNTGTVTVTVSSTPPPPPPPPPSTTPPAISGPSGSSGDATSAKSVNENTAAVHTFSATTTPAGQTVTWSIDGGADGAKFTLNPATGELSFISAPDFENPTDSDKNNTYVVVVKATDQNGNVSTQTLTVTVLDLPSLTITANNDTKTYGQTKSYGAGSTSFTATGLLPGQTIGSVTMTASGGASASAAPGTYTLTPSAPTGGTFNAASYDGITYVSGTLTVDKAVVTVKADDKTKSEGSANPTLTVSYSGFVNNESLSSSGISGTPVLATTATTGSTPGNYPITVTTGTLSADNYTFVFVSGTLTVNEDLDDDNDGIPDSIENAACSPASADCDTDGDGTPNRLDLESDGDGIPDVVEANGTDTDKDGIADGPVDAYGVPSSASGGLTPPDTDSDGKFDPYDLDSDGDGIPDKTEAGPDPKNPVDTDGDGIPDYRDLDSDGDGIPDKEEAGADPSKPRDSDGDGIPDYVDLDSDNDGITDKVEFEGAGANLDTDKDGVPDHLDLDSDGDGLKDVVEAGGKDTDKDGRADGASDPKGVPQSANGGLNPPDTDGDGKRDFQDTDSDGDGLSDKDEAGPDPSKPRDSDGDGIPDYLDLDSDNDGITDKIESQGAGATLDTDKDGLPDHLDLDSDGDGLTDVVEADGKDADKDGRADGASDPKGVPQSANGGLNPPDTDGDGKRDFQDLDSDADGIPDNVEGQDATYVKPSGKDTDKDGIDDAYDKDSGGKYIVPFDLDGDGKPDFRDLDSDGDGIPDKTEAGSNPANPVDSDGDGVPDFRDLDSDGDGISDKDELGNDPANPKDTDKDGVPDYLDIDSDNDGITDRTEYGTTGVTLDTDKDGVPDYLDLDSDGDGIADVIEANGKDADGDGRADGAADSKGIPTSANGGLTPPDTDGDGKRDFQDVDSDADGISDNLEGQQPYKAPSGKDTDKDGLDDAYDKDNGGTPIVPVDTDKDGKPDYRDVDSDGDGIPDEDEKGADPNKPQDSDGDGIPDYRELDSDNDGIPDNEALLVWKTASTPVLATDGSFTIRYSIVVKNSRKEPLTNVQVKDDLSRTFPSPMQFSVVSMTSSGALTAATGYDGRTSINLLASGITLAGLKEDSIILTVKVLPNGYSGGVQNTADATANTKWFALSRQSIDITRSGGRRHGTGVPTPSTIPDVNVFISDVLTPNNDGYNDKWIILRPSNVKVGITIFNRWGQVVYKDADYRNNWDGQSTNGFSGNLLPNGTYYYLVELSGGRFTAKEVRKGYITLKREY